MNDDGIIIRDIATGRANPEALAETHWPEIAQPFALPHAIREFLDVVRWQIGDFEIAKEGRPELIHIRVTRE
jgi:hypothetical protein